MKAKRSFFLYFFLLIWGVIWLWFRFDPIATETYYSRGIYTFIAPTLQFLWGWIPFSVGDLLYTSVILGVIYFFVRYFRSIWQRPKWFFSKIFFRFVWIFVLFFSLWGFNYFRMPIEKSLDVKQEYSTETIFNTTKFIIKKANQLHNNLAENDSVLVRYQYTKDEMYRIASSCYPLKINDLQLMSYRFPSIKPSLYSTILTYMGYSGYLNPITNEAQINNLMIGYSTPHTICHEIAHQMGFAAENEANFIGFAAAYNSDNQHFKYSAMLFALRQLLAEVRHISPTQHANYIKELNSGILKNYDEVRQFWQQYENKAEPVFKATYDTFLKANKQQEGIRSYGLTTGLIINFLQTETESNYPHKNE